MPHKSVVVKPRCFMLFFFLSSVPHINSEEGSAAARGVGGSAPHKNARGSAAMFGVGGSAPHINNEKGRRQCSVHQ